MNYYENWNTLISNIDAVPEQLDGEKLIVIGYELLRTQEERELLRQTAAAGDQASLESLINSYVPMIIRGMKRYARRIGYNRDVLINCMEKVRERVADNLYIDNFEYNISRYVDWMVKDEVSHYIAVHSELLKKTSADKMNKGFSHESLEEMMDKISTVITDENQAESLKELLPDCMDDMERQLISFRFGLEDGVPKTLQEMADKFGISRERAMLIVSRVMRRSSSRRMRRRKSLLDFLDD